MSNNNIDAASSRGAMFDRAHADLCLCSVSVDHFRGSEYHHVGGSHFLPRSD